MSEQRRFWQDCADVQARLNLRCSHRLEVPNSLDAVQMKNTQEKGSIGSGGSVQIENVFTQNNCLSSQGLPNSFPCAGLFSLHLTTIEDSYNLFFPKFVLSIFVCIQWAHLPLIELI